MFFFLSSQDLHVLDLALVDNKQVVQQVHVKTTPELFLAVVDEYVTSWNVALDTLEGVIVVSGPGSFTSSRLTVTIANTMAFRFNIPVVAVENPQRLSIEQLVDLVDFNSVGPEFVNPTYDRPPHIT